MKIFQMVNIVPLFLFILLGCVKNKANTEENLMGFYYSLRERDIVTIKKYLESGIDPDHGSNTLYWDDRNPLWMILDGGTIDIDLDILKLLIDFGANVNLRPYIWHTLDQRILTEENIAWMEAADGRAITGTTIDLMQKKIEILIKAGADVTRKGAPNRQLFPSTEKKYHKYFEREGSKPINYAIKKNFPTIVDLLSQYTILDEESLDAAKLSKDPSMIEKINKMWEKQQPGVTSTKFEEKGKYNENK